MAKNFKKFLKKREYCTPSKRLEKGEDKANKNKEFEA